MLVHFAMNGSDMGVRPAQTAIAKDTSVRVALTSLHNANGHRKIPQLQMLRIPFIIFNLQRNLAVLVQQGKGLPDNTLDECQSPIYMPTRIYAHLIISTQLVIAGTCEEITSRPL
jgi:hypothetical protein